MAWARIVSFALTPPVLLLTLVSSLRYMGAMSVFTFSGDGTYSKPVTMKTSMTEADFSGKDLGTSGALMLSAFLPKCT
jgi:hypothetical protein